MKCVKYLLNSFGGRNVVCTGQTTFHEPIGVKYKKKDYINKIKNCLFKIKYFRSNNIWMGILIEMDLFSETYRF